MPLFWGNRRLFARNEPGVRNALRHPLLQGRPVIGRGAYSIVLGGDASVFKLTIDSATYALAEHQSVWRCPSLPYIHELHGKIGELEYGVPLFLIEMESLTKLETGTLARKRCLSIGRQMRMRFRDGICPSEDLRQVGKQQADKSLGDGLKLLAGFLESRWPDVSVDLHGANFMCRPETGEPVISDPFVDLKTRHIALKNYAHSLPEGTIIL